MGQSNEPPSDDNGCFAPCYRKPPHPNDTHRPAPYNQPHNKHLNNHNPRRPPLKKATTAPQVLETSLEMRLQEQASDPPEQQQPPKKTNLLESATVRPPQKPLSPMPSPTPSTARPELDSKFGSSKKGFGSTKTTNFTKGSTVEGGNHRASSAEKEPGSETTANSKNGEGARNKRRLIKNRIEEVKQKYYERELEIEIYQDEESYQARIERQDKENRDKSVGLPPPDKTQEVSLQYSKAPNQAEGSNAQASNNNNDLELFSREDSRREELGGRNSHRSKRERRERFSTNNRSLSMDNNLSVNVSGNTSVESAEPMSFSEISNVSLQQIREVDEEEEEYISRLSRLKATTQPQLSAFRKGPSPPPSQHPSKIKAGRRDHEDKGESSSEEESEEGARQVRVGEGGEGKGHKILLF